MAKARLADLLDRSPEIRSAVEGAVRIFNGTPGDARSFDPLDALLEAQSYRLAFWRVAAEEINYRRFFAINELAAIRQEDPAVFAATHQLLLELIGNGSVDGVRIDHPDGLWDPAGYLRDLQRAAFAARYRAEWVRNRTPDRIAADWPVANGRALPGGGTLSGRPGRSAIDSSRSTWSSRRSSQHGESLPADWATAGTVGYDFMTRDDAAFRRLRERRPLRSPLPALHGHGDPLRRSRLRQEADDHAPGAGQRGRGARPGARSL